MVKSRGGKRWAWLVYTGEISEVKDKSESEAQCYYPITISTSDFEAFFRQLGDSRASLQVVGNCPCDLQGPSSKECASPPIRNGILL